MGNVGILASNSSSEHDSLWRIVNALDLRAASGIVLHRDLSAQNKDDDPKKINCDRSERLRGG